MTAQTLLTREAAPRPLNAVEPSVPVAAPPVRCADTGLYMRIVPLKAYDNPNGRERWHNLAVRALVPNVFYEPEFAIPAMIPFGDDVQLLLIADERGPDVQLLGLLPFRISTRRWGVPLPVAVAWNHPFAALGVPLIDRDRARDTIATLLNAARVLPGMPRRMVLPLIPDHGPFAELLDELLQQDNLRELRLDRYARAILDPPLGARDHYLENKLSSRTRGKMRTELRRIERQGTVTFETITARDEIDDALEDFLALEAAGWKGRGGTAVSCSPAEIEFLRQTVRNLAACGRVRIDRLRLDGRTLASSIIYLTGDQAWCAKICYDESQAASSPGSQLVMYITSELLADPSIARADSCTPPNRPFMSKFWGEQLALSNRVIELAGGDPLHPLAAMLEQGRRRLSHAFHEFKERRNAGHDKRRPANGDSEKQSPSE